MTQRTQANFLYLYSHTLVFDVRLYVCVFVICFLKIQTNVTFNVFFCESLHKFSRTLELGRSQFHVGVRQAPQRRRPAVKRVPHVASRTARKSGIIHVGAVEVDLHTSFKPPASRVLLSAVLIRVVVVVCIVSWELVIFVPVQTVLYIKAVTNTDCSRSKYSAVYIILYKSRNCSLI